MTVLRDRRTSNFRIYTLNFSSANAMLDDFQQNSYNYAKSLNFLINLSYFRQKLHKIKFMKFSKTPDFLMLF